MARCDGLPILSAMIVLLQIITAPALKTGCPIHLHGSITKALREEESCREQLDVGLGVRMGKTVLPCWLP